MEIKPVSFAGLSIITQRKSGLPGEERYATKNTEGTEWPKRHSDGCPHLNLLREMYKRRGYAGLDQRTPAGDDGLRA
jgi:hypothetical protein